MWKASIPRMTARLGAAEHVVGGVGVDADVVGDGGGVEAVRTTRQTCFAVLDREPLAGAELVCAAAAAGTRRRA
jgi:hypothetical protein